MSPFFQNLSRPLSNEKGMGPVLILVALSAVVGSTSLIQQKFALQSFKKSIKTNKQAVAVYSAEYAALASYVHEQHQKQQNPTQAPRAANSQPDTYRLNLQQTLQDIARELGVPQFFTSYPTNRREVGRFRTVASRILSFLETLQFDVGEDDLSGNYESGELSASVEKEAGTNVTKYCGTMNYDAASQPEKVCLYAAPQGCVPDSSNRDIKVFGRLSEDPSNPYYTYFNPAIISRQIFNHHALYGMTPPPGLAHSRPIVMAYGASGGGFRWPNKGTPNPVKMQAYCQMLGYSEYVSSDCWDSERRRGRYPGGKCNYHSPGGDPIQDYNPASEVFYSWSLRSSDKYRITWLSKLVCQSKMSCN